MGPTLLWLLGACAAMRPAPIDEGALLAEVSRLHRASYDAWATDGEPEALYATLSGVWTGRALTEQYVSQRVALARLRAARGGLTLRGHRVEEASLSRLDAEGATVRLRWLVGGLVTHEGHSHARVSRYEAVYEVVFTAEGPRLAGVWPKDQRRLAAPPPDAESWFDDPALDPATGAAPGGAVPLDALRGGG
ncbi:hypothetical protein L6R49_27960 [Myxococcota bacterium]|nr:hypothetical protein [Myxococcota bacterium]